MNTKYENKIAEVKVRELFEVFGINFDTVDTEDTPKRFVAMWYELTKGLRKPDFECTVFPNDENFDQMIVLEGIPYWSMCSHHFMPFFGVTHIGYIPDKSYLGLSKFARVVEHFSTKPSVQERLTQEVANYLFDKLTPLGLIIVTEGRHLCMEARGIKKAYVKTKFSAIKGNIDKHEFFHILDLQSKK